MKRSGQWRNNGQAGWHWLLVFVLLGQAAIPLQAHTALTADASGRVVVVCTWSGPRAQWLGHDGGDTQASLDRASPAVVFSQLLAAADLAGPATALHSVFVPLSTFSETTSAVVYAAIVASYAIRAPPATPIVT